MGYLGFGEPFNRWAYRVRARAFGAAVESVWPTRGELRVLDVGSGTGFYVDQWERLGVASVAISDLTGYAVERLRRRFPGREVVELDLTGTSVPFARASFDAISAMDVLFHIVDHDQYRQAFTNLTNLLKPGGFLIFTEDFVQAEVPSEPHRVSRQLSTIEQVMDEVKLEPVVRRPIFFLMNIPLDSSRRLHARWWRALSSLVSRHQRVGAVAGAALYPIEVTLGRVMRGGPSTEIMVCRKAT